MTVSDLRDYLASLSSEYDNYPVMTTSSDHRYRLVSAGVTNAEVTRFGYFEYFNKANMSKDGRKVKILLID